ncbi:MAG: hypothetical protein AMXMBFR13_51620 [Phycisphaerae bacterium]
MFDVIVVGGGPAGLSAALVLGRARRRVLVCDAGHPRNAASRGLNGYLTRDGVAPGDLLRIGREEIARYGVEFRAGEVVDVSCQPGAVGVLLSDGTRLHARKVLLATGIRDRLPVIEGVEEFYGRSVFHCPYCDGWEMRDQRLAAYGPAKEASGLALSLLTWSRDVVVCACGDARLSRRRLRELKRLGIPIRSERIVRLEGHEGVLERIIFENGEALPRRALFFNTGQGQRSGLAARLGCRFDTNGHVHTDRRGRTGVTHLYLAGDAAGEVQFAIVAAAEGASAAVAINQELQEEDREQRVAPANKMGAAL